MLSVNLLLKYEDEELIFFSLFKIAENLFHNVNLTKITDNSVHTSNKNVLGLITLNIKLKNRAVRTLSHPN